MDVCSFPQKASVHRVRRICRAETVRSRAEGFPGRVLERRRWHLRRRGPSGAVIRMALWAATARCRNSTRRLSSSKTTSSLLLVAEPRTCSGMVDLPPTPGSVQPPTRSFSPRCCRCNFLSSCVLCSFFSFPTIRAASIPEQKLVSARPSLSLSPSLLVHAEHERNFHSERTCREIVVMA